MLQQMLENARKNFKIYTQTQGMNILFNGNKTAAGVNVTTMRMRCTLTARKEVVASAGPVSAVLLFRYNWSNKC